MNQKHFITIAMLEGLVLFSAVIRVALQGLDFGNSPTLVWFVAVMTIAAGSITHFVLRNSMLGPRVRAGENVEDERKQIFVISIAIVIGAAMLSAAGPGAFAKVMGQPAEPAVQPVGLAARAPRTCA